MNVRLSFALIIALTAVIAFAGPSVQTGNDQTMILENDLLRVEITPLGGRIIGLYDKLRDRENAKTFDTKNLGGLNEFRFRGQLALNDQQSIYTLTKAESGPDSVVVVATFDLPDDAGTVVKTYTLRRDSADIRASLKITNNSDEQMSLMPWVRHLLLRGDELPEEAHMLPHGAFLWTDWGQPVPGQPTLNTSFDRHFFPAGNWSSRVLLPVNEQSNALISVLRPEDMLRIYNWHRGTEDFSTQEFIAAPIFVPPGESRSMTYHIVVTAPVRNIVYASPMLVIGATPHPSGIAPETGSLELSFSTTQSVASLDVDATLTEVGSDDPIKRTQFTVKDLSPDTIETHAMNISLEDGKAYQLALRFTQDGQPWKPGAEVGDDQPVIIPITAGHLHPTEAVFPPRDEKLDRLKRIPPRDIEAPLVARSQTMAVFSRPADARVFPEDHFRPDGDDHTVVQLHAARGDYEALQIVLQSTSDQNKFFRVRATDLTHRDGHRIPNDSLNRFIYVITKMPSKYSANYPLGTFPEALLPTDEIEVQPNGNAPLFILYQIPDDVPPGDYTGEVYIGDDLKVAVRLTVWNITLPKRSPWYDAPVSLKGLDTGGVVIRNPDGEPMSQQELLRAVEDIHFKNRLTPCDSGFTRSLLALDFESFEPTMQRYVDNGATKIFLGSIPWILKNFGEENLPQVEAYLESKGWKDYFYVRPGFDEASTDLIPRIAETCRRWKEISDIQIMETYYNDYSEPLFGLIDIYCRGGATRIDWMDEREAAGDEFWKVNRKAEPLEVPLWDHRRKFLAHFDNRITGTYVWTIKQWSTVDWAEENYWADGGVGNLDSGQIWPHETGVLSTIRLNTMREAIEDNALLWMLRNKVEQLEEKPVKDQRLEAALQQARQILESGPLEHAIDSPEKLHRLRLRVGDTLSKLNTITPSP